MQSASVPSPTKSAAGNPHDEIRHIKKTEGGKNLNTIVLTDVDFYPVIQPILEILDAILWPAIAIVVAVGTIYCIFLGVKISKADEQNSREGQEGSRRSLHRLRAHLRSDIGIEDRCPHLGGLGQVTDVEQNMFAKILVRKGFAFRSSEAKKGICRSKRLISRTGYCESRFWPTSG